jgi:hypothetical protein
MPSGEHGHVQMMERERRMLVDGLDRRLLDASP